MAHHQTSPGHGTFNGRPLKVDPHELGHIVPFSSYRNTFLWLVVLTVITVGAAAMNLSAVSTTLAMVVAMVIASVKAFLVACNFMHLRYENPVTWLYAFFPIFLLVLLIGLTFLDNANRTLPSGEPMYHSSQANEGSPH